ncbi:MAG: YgjP-like metallopeptidase domain-containing protein, partial [Bacteroidales bacterium]
MRGERLYFLDDVGGILIKKRKGSRRMTIRVNSEGDIRVTIPFYASFIMAEKFLEEKKDWILKTLRKMKERKPERVFYTSENLPRTKYHEFIITPVKEEELSFKLSQGLCEIFIPERMDLKADDTQQWIRKA